MKFAKKIIINKRTISLNHPTYFIADIAANHDSNLNRAKDLIWKAKKAGADAVKFQKRDNKTLLSDKQYRGKHPVPHNSFGKTYGEHREYLEFNTSTHEQIFQYCKKKKKNKIFMFCLGYQIS